MELSCPDCKRAFSALGSGKEPMVLPCGDSYCNECLKELAGLSPNFMCILPIIQAKNVERTLTLNRAAH